MPQPALGDRHVDSLLTQFSLLSLQNEQGFVASRVCPVVRVAKQSDYYAKYTDAFFRRNVMKPRAPATESAGGGYEVDNTSTYRCDKFAVHLDIADDQRRNADSVFQLDSEATKFLTHQALLNMEESFATDIFATSTWTGSTTGGDITPSTKWDASGGLPIADIRLQMRSVKKKSGQKPNKLVCGALAWDVIRENADVLDRIKHTQRGQVTTDIVAGLLELDEVLVADSIYTSSVEGHATESTAYRLTEDSALLLYVPPSPGIMTPMAACTFVWTGDQGMGLNDAGAAIKKFRMEGLEADRIEINQYFDHVQTAATMGAFFINVDS